MQILVIEDDPISGRIAEGVAEILGDDFTLATTGTEGLELCKNHDYDLIIIDIRLPDMEGHNVAARLRKTEKHRHSFLVALSAHILRASDERFHLKDFNYFRPKPLMVDVLTEMKELVAKHKKALAIYEE